MKLKLADIKPNPFRDLQRNPLSPEKIAKIKQSIGRTGFWDNVVVRINSKGEPELAYGHTRRQAAIEAGIEEADFIVKDFTNEQMLQAMTDENSEDYRYSILAALESVRGFVNALAEGDIPPFDIPENTRKDYIYYAPSYVPGKESTAAESAAVRYTILSLALKLGDLRKNKEKTIAGEKTIAVVGALNLIELGLMTEAEIKNWNVDQLAKEVAIRRAGYEKTVIQRNQEQAQQRKLNEQGIALQKQREAEIAAQVQRDEELLKKAREASKEKEEAELKRVQEERRVAKEREETRQKKFEESRKKLDEKIAASQQREQQVVKVSITETRAKRASGELQALRSEFELVARPHSHLGEKLQRLSEFDLGANERELFRKSLLTLGDWYIEQANLFLPKKVITPKQILEDLQQKEDNNRKKSEATELYQRVQEELKKTPEKKKEMPKPKAKVATASKKKTAKKTSKKGGKKR